MSGIKTTGSVSSTGIFGLRSQSSGSKLDGTTFVAPTTEEGRQLRKAFKGQGSVNTVLTVTPNGPVVARHGQTGLFNLSSFQKVKTGEQPIPQVGLPLENQGQLNPLPQEPDDNEELPALDDRVDDAIVLKEELGLEILDWQATRQTPGPSKDDDLRRDILTRSQFLDALSARSTELYELERRVRAEPESEQRTEMLARLTEARQDVALLAVQLELPDLAIRFQDDSSLRALAKGLVELEDKLRAGREGNPKLSDAPLRLGQLLAILADYGRTRELSRSPLPERQTGAVEGLTALVETIVQAVGSGRDGVELNSLFGLNGELDDMLKEVRFGAICQLLRDDLEHGRDLQNHPVTPGDLEKIRNEARELVDLDYELTQCQRQIGRALKAGKFGDVGKQIEHFFSKSREGVAFDDLVGKVGDTSLLKGLREKFGKESEHVGVLLAALKEVTQLARDCDGAQRVRGALERQVVRKQGELGQLRIQHGPQLRDLSELSTQIRNLDRQAKQALDSGDGRTHEALAQMIEVVLEQAALIEIDLEPLRKLEQEIGLLHERIDALIPESERVEGELETARQSEIRLRDEKTLLEQTLANLNRAIAEHPPGTVDNLKELHDELQPRLEAITKRHGYAQSIVQGLEDRQNLLQNDKTRSDLEQLIDEARREIASATSDLRQISEQLSVLALEIDSVSMLIAQRRNPKGEDLREKLDDLTEEFGNLDVRKQALQHGIGAWREVIDSSQVRLLELPETSLWAGGGLTSREVDELGLSGKQPDEILKTTRALARQGIANTGEVAQLCRDINSVVHLIGEVGPRSSQGIENGLNVLNARNNEEVARRFTGALLGSLLGEEIDDVLSPDLNDRMKEALTGNDGRLAGLTEMLRQNPGDNLLLGLGQRYGQVETSLLDRIQGFEDVRASRGAARQVVSEFTGRKIDPKHPTGLRVSEALEEICQIRDLCNGDENALTEDQLLRFNVLAKQLRGFDPLRLDTRFPQFLHPPPIMQDIDGWLQHHPRLRETARAIITLRLSEDAHEDHYIEVARQVEQLDGLVEARHEAMGQAGEVLRDAIRSAILHRLVMTGSKIDEFRPSDHAREIRQTLRDWGVPVDDVLPEIDHALSETFGPSELNLWRETTTLSRDYLRSVRIEKNREVSKLVESSETQRLDPETAKTLFGSIDNLQPGTKVKLFVGTRGEIQTGRLNTPVSVLRLNIRGGFGGVNGLEIARSSSDGYELIIRQGYESRVGTDLSVGPKLNGGVLGALRLEGVGSVEGGGSRVTGVTLRFRNDKDGCEALKQTLTTLLTKGEITPQDLSSVDNLLPIVEHKGHFRAGLTGQVRFLGSGVSENIAPWMPSGQMRVGGSFTGAGKWYTAQNTRLTVDKTDKDTLFELGGGLSLYTSNPTGHPINHPLTGSNLDPNLVGIDVQGGISWFFRTKTKQTRGLDGLVTASTELQYQRTLPLGWNGMTSERRLLELKALGGASFVRLLDKLGGEQRAEVERVIFSAGSGDMLNVAFTLDERVRTAVNGLLEEAKAIRSGRISSRSRDEAETRAKVLEDRARRMLDDPDNYNPSKLQLIPTRENQQALSLNLLGFFRLERYVEDKSEWVALEMKFDPTVGREIRDELTGV